MTDRAIGTIALVSWSPERETLQATVETWGTIADSLKASYDGLGASYDRLGRMIENRCAGLAPGRVVAIEFTSSDAQAVRRRARSSY